MLSLSRDNPGPSVELNTHSIPFNDGNFAHAVYFQNKEKLSATINCSENSWTVNDDEQAYTPKSQTTKNLIKLACDIKKVKNKTEGIGYFIVYAPVSKLRSTPNDTNDSNIICDIDTMQLIKPYGDPQNKWHSTDVFCKDGNQKKGFIHDTQLKRLS